MLWVDRRWEGEHGIGRYAREVVGRLDLDYREIGGTSSPASPIDVLNTTRFRAGRGDVIYNPGYNVGAAAARQIITLHDLIHLEFGSPLRRVYYERVVKPVVRRVGEVLTVSETSRLAIEEWIDDSSVRVINAGNGCSEAFSPYGDTPDAGAPYLVFVGNLKRHKNLGVVLAALSRTANLRLVAVTPDPQAVREAAVAAGCGARVDALAGLTDAELATYYRGAAATVVPSLVEGFGLPAVESLACGTPVVYWRGCNSVREIVGSVGHAVEDGRDVEEWASALAGAESLARVDAASVSTRYSWEAVADAVRTRLLEAGAQ